LIDRTALTDATVTLTTSEKDAAALGARNLLVITLLLISTFVVFLNETFMSVALPQLMESLRIDANAAQWLTSAFMLTMAVVIPVTGFLLQRFHTRTIFIAAMTLFSAGTLFAALAPTFEFLLAARVVQASGTAIMVPLLFTTVLTLVPEASRGRVMGNISIVISVAPALGPAISGFILSVLDWRFLFIIILPIAIAALVVGAVRVPNVTEPRVVPLDILSVVLSAFGFGGLVYGLSNIGMTVEGIRSPSSWVPLAIGVVALALFIARQVRLQKTDTALLDLRTFKARTFAVAVAMLTASMMALFGVIILLPIYTQSVLQLGALETGLLLLPGGLVMGLLGPFVGRLYDRIGPRLLVVSGSIVVSAVLWGMTFLAKDTSFWWVLAAHIVLSVGFALLFTPLFTAGLGDIEPSLYSHGSAVVGTVQQIAGAAGVALFVTVMSVVAASSAGEGEIAATANGIHTAFVIGAIISLVSIPLAFLVRRPASREWAGGAPAGH
jgi:DHA2 family lincomycin resistance protein-like MFS transporter